MTFKVTEIRAHPQFSRIGFYNDIAILVLDKPARKSKYVIPLCLPPPELRTEKFAGKRTTVVGWGTTYYGKNKQMRCSCYCGDCTGFLGGKESTVQRQAVLPIWRNEDCNDAYFQPITSNFICAGYAQGGTDACQVMNDSCTFTKSVITETCFLGRFRWTIDDSLGRPLDASGSRFIW